jgi:hypothetical protein
MSRIYSGVKANTWRKKIAEASKSPGKKTLRLHITLVGAAL